MIGSFEVGVIMGTIVGVGLAYCAYIIHGWWQSTHPKDVDWDPTLERIRRL